MKTGDLIKIYLICTTRKTFLLASYPNKEEAMKTELCRVNMRVIDIPEKIVHNKEDSHATFCFGMVMESDHTNKVMKVAHSSTKGPWMVSWVKMDYVDLV